MIATFPTPYEDELLFSILSRYALHSGYLSYASIAEDLFVFPNSKPNMEFCNLLTEEVMRHLGSINIIQNHTLFNYYRAFLSSEKQQALLSTSAQQLANLLPLPKSKYTRYLRCCPICVQEERALYGESYWHRAHQLYGVSVCFRHGCRLLNSHIEITSKSSPVLITSEETMVCVNNEIVFGSNIEMDLANYAYAVLNCSSLSKNPVGTFLQYRIRSTKYLSARGAKRNIELLSSDIVSYYKGINLYGFGQAWQLEKIFNNQRFNPFEICLVGMFLGIDAKELVIRDIEDTSNYTIIFDNKIRKLKQQGFNYREIASMLGTSYDHCKFVVSNRKTVSTHRSAHKNGGAKKKDWIKLDMETLPKAKALIEELGNEEGRPKRITMKLIERMLELKEGQLSHLPHCKEYINKHIVSQEEHWARLTRWAIKALQEEHRSITITNILHLTNMRKAYLKAAVPYLNKYLDEEIVVILNMINACESK